MSVPRKIVSLAGPLAQFAVADDGSVWFWNSMAWVSWGRPALPDREDAATVMASYRGHTDVAATPVERLLPSPTFSQEARDAEYRRRAAVVDDPPTYEKMTPEKIRALSERVFMEGPNPEITGTVKRGRGRPRKEKP